MTERGGIRVGVGSSSNNRLMGSNYTIHTQRSKKWFLIERDYIHTGVGHPAPKKERGFESMNQILKKGERTNLKEKKKM